MTDLPRPVQVLHDGRWLDGWLELVQSRGDGWWGTVRYTVAPGFTYLQVRHQRELRKSNLAKEDPHA